MAISLRTKRQLFPLGAGIIVILLTSLVWHSLRTQRDNATRAMVTFQAIHIKQEIMAQLGFQMYALHNIANRWEVRGGTSLAEWQVDVKNLMANYPGFVALLSLDQSLSLIAKESTLDARDIDTIIYAFSKKLLSLSPLFGTVKNSGVVELPSGRTLFLLYLPLGNHQQWKGYIVGVMDVALFFRSAFANEIDGGYVINIFEGPKNILFGGKVPEEIQSKWVKVARLGFSDVDWQIQISPSVRLLEQQNTDLPALVLWFGIALAFLIMLTTFLSQLLTHHKSIASHALKQEAIKRERAEQVKNRLEKALLHNQKLQSIGTLAGGIAHDFNNILYAMLGYVEMARQDVPVDSLLYKNLTKVLTTGERGKKLINSILSFSRQQPQAFEVVDLYNILDVCLDLLLPTIPTVVTLKRVIEVDTAPIFGSRLELEQVIINCVNNAVDAIDGHGRIEITLTAASATDAPLNSVSNLVADHYYCIRIKDNGCGMSEEVLKRLFEPFYTTKEVGKGTGLGLAMAHGIIENHRGIILANSKVGSGTTIYIFLPEYAVKVS